MPASGSNRPENIDIRNHRVAVSRPLRTAQQTMALLRPLTGLFLKVIQLACSVSRTDSTLVCIYVAARSVLEKNCGLSGTLRGLP